MAGQYARENSALGKLKHQETRSTDGQRIRIAANMSLPDEINSITHSGAEGVGLFRTEFMLMEDARFASEDAQFAIYKQVATAMPERLIVVRTLDIGSDKLVQDASYDDGNNPALGLRGLRLGLAHQELLRPQIRALLRAATYGISPSPADC